MQLHLHIKLNNLPHLVFWAKNGPLTDKCCFILFNSVLNTRNYLRMKGTNILVLIWTCFTLTHIIHGEIFLLSWNSTIAIFMKVR